MRPRIRPRTSLLAYVIGPLIAMIVTWAGLLDVVRGEGGSAFAATHSVASRARRRVRGSCEVPMEAIAFAEEPAEEAGAAVPFVVRGVVPAEVKDAVTETRLPWWDVSRFETAVIGGAMPITHPVRFVALRNLILHRWRERRAIGQVTRAECGEVLSCTGLQQIWCAEGLWRSSAAPSTTGFRPARPPHPCCYSARARWWRSRISPRSPGRPPRVALRAAGMLRPCRTFSGGSSASTSSILAPPSASSCACPSPRPSGHSCPPVAPSLSWALAWVRTPWELQHWRDRTLARSNTCATEHSRDRTLARSNTCATEHSRDRTLARSKHSARSEHSRALNTRAL